MANNDIDNMLLDQIGDMGSNKPTEEKQISEVTETPIVKEAEEIKQPEQKQEPHYIGTKLGHIPGESPFANKEKDKEVVEQHKLSRIGEKLGENVDIREGWIPVDKVLLGERANFYPEEWEFRIRPATVEAIRNWSNIDDENAIVIDDVFNEIIKSCVSIVGPGGRPIPWGNLRSWDRFFFLLLVREYTFKNGEQKVKYEEECPECENPIEFELTSQSLLYEFPDKEVMKYWNREDGCWYIDPEEFNLEGESTIKLYPPTLEKDANIKAWTINRVQENQNRRIDQTFYRFVSWLTPKISKDLTIAKKQLKELEMKYKSWDADMFSFMDEVIRNIIVTPQTKLIITCPICGEEVTSQIRFPHSIKELFAIKTKFKKFGSK